ncbi:MAG TPA: cytochrome b N-terminal domain-containing protein [Gemmatimonadaceae bacterium]|nr:cytochrome b N-terminal domain-containing protein [Gemmatimonadaceae bacterium]
MPPRRWASPITDRPAPTPPTPLGRAIKERLAWDALEYRIAPVANRLPYMLGGLTFSGLVSLIITGIVLDQFYNPSPTGAHDSVLYIMTRVPLGNWVRAIHYWSATLVLVSVVLHLVYVFRRRSYQRPREVTWWAGVLLYATLFALAFTGTALRADQEGTEAVAHAVAGARLVGAFGAPFTPDFTASAPLLARLHAMHVSFLPIVLLALVGLHFFLIRFLGIHAGEATTVPFTHHLRKLTGYALLLLSCIGVLAAFFPPGIGYPGIEGAEVTKPYWPFLWIYSVENSVGLVGMVVAPLVLFGFLFVVPLLDRPRDAGSVRPRWLIGLAVVVLLLFVGAIVHGALAPQMQHLGM